VTLPSTLRLTLAIAAAQFALFVGAPGQSIDPAKAASSFAEAKELSDKDAGHLWGLPLYGPILFVDPSSRDLVANQPDPQGTLHQQGAVWAGKLPPELLPANTALYWQGKHWTMVMWPLPEHALPRRRLIAHELFHRLQDDLHLPQVNTQNPQLDTLEGRYWLQLEWRALADALLADGDSQTAAIRDALAFRAHRRQKFPESSETERLLELNEGLAEYTGYAASAPDRPSAIWRISADLVSPQVATFVRSFAYTSGPAYGLLLDQRSPAWRSQLTPKSDFGALLALTLSDLPCPIHRGPIAMGGSSQTLQCPDPDARALLYGGAALRISETERAAQTQADQARYRKLLVDGPTLTLADTGSGKFNFSYDPNTVIPLPGFGNVNPMMEVFDIWGSLKAEQGALLSVDMKTVTIAAPSATTSTHITGPGWTLDLAPGWTIIAETPGHYALRKP
jgi:hypothetical protein